MGGKKKIGLKKMERMQMRRGEQERRKKEKTVGPKEKKSPGIIPPDPKSEKIVDELKRMRVLTPYNVASRFNIRISAAKGFLKQLEEKGVVQLVSGNHSIKIYKTVD
jgi:small subunit ribosomal protein S25e